MIYVGNIPIYIQKETFKIDCVIVVSMDKCE